MKNAKYYCDVRTIERIEDNIKKKGWEHDFNLATSLMVGIDTTTYLDLKAENYLKLVFYSVLGRLSVGEVLDCLMEVIEKIANDTYQTTYKQGEGNKKAGKLKQLIDSNLSILQVVKDLGFKVKGNRMVCPFHSDTTPSLQIYPKTNSWYCFGCGEGGDIIKFFVMAKRCKNG